MITSQKLAKRCSLHYQRKSIKSKKIGKSFNIDSKMDITSKLQRFLNIKDYTDNFRVNLKYRFLNPTKSEFGKISKHILQQISTKIRTTLNVNQWQNSSEVIKWFKKIKTKTYIRLPFLKFKNSTHLSVRNFLKMQFYIHKLIQASVGRILK